MWHVIHVTAFTKWRKTKQSSLSSTPTIGSGPEKTTTTRESNHLLGCPTLHPESQPARACLCRTEFYISPKSKMLFSATTRSGMQLAVLESVGHGKILRWTTSGIQFLVYSRCLRYLPH